MISDDFSLTISVQGEFVQVDKNSNWENQHAERGNRKLWITENYQILSSTFYEDVSLTIDESSFAVDHYFHTFDNIDNYKIKCQNYPF